MKFNQSLTAAVTAAALVAGAGFAYAQTSTTQSSPQVTNQPGDSSAQGPIQNQGTSGTTGTSGSAGSMNSNSTVQSQPSTSGSTDSGSMNNSGTSSVDSTLEPRADRN